MDYEKLYKETLERAREWYNNPNSSSVGKAYLYAVFPELKENEDERMCNIAIYACKYMVDNFENSTKQYEDAIAWLKKQNDINETTNNAKFAQCVLRGAALNLITWIDYNAAEGNTCLSNMECKDIEDALVSGDWDKIYGYMKKKLEKQGERKPNRVGTKEATGTLKEMLDNIDPIELEKTRKTMLEVDGFDAELNALLKKYEYLPKEELAECLEFYLGVVNKSEAEMTNKIGDENE